MQEGGASQLPAGGVPIEHPPRWQPWTPAEVAQRLASVEVPWAIAAGWALDLFRGEVTRVHEDIEVAVPSSDFGAIRAALAPLEFELVGSGLRWSIDDAEAFAVTHQTWLRDPAAGVYRLDVFREPHDGRTWICRREPRLRRDYADLVRHTSDGLPYVAPEVVLLFKARWMRPKDVDDFEGALSLLDDHARGWLIAALSLVHPGHQWIGRLAR